MSILILQLPARSRLSADPAAAESNSSASSALRDYAYVLSADGQSVARQGRCALSMMPRADCSETIS